MVERPARTRDRTATRLMPDGFRPARARARRYAIHAQASLPERARAGQALPLPHGFSAPTAHRQRRRPDQRLAPHAADGRG